MSSELSKITFRELSRQAGKEIPDDEFRILATQDSLTEWLYSVYDTPFGEFSNFDLCRALRQEMYPNEIISVAIDRCIEDPAAGDLFDSEVAMKVIENGNEFFQSHPEELKRFLSIIPDAIAATNNPEDQEFLRAFWRSHR